LYVVGFDDAPMASRMTPTLTTVRQDADAKGRLAATALTRQLAHHADIPDVLLPTELVVRASTCPPPAA
jgi:DNA-binding LacI/PurR family transcriptional regulator